MGNPSGGNPNLLPSTYEQKMDARRAYLAKPGPISIVDGRRFELVHFFRPEELWGSVSGEVVSERARNTRALLGRENAEMFLEHAAEIGAEWQRFCPVFPDLLIWYLIWRGRNAGWRIGQHEVNHALLEQHFRLVMEI